MMSEFVCAFLTATGAGASPFLFNGYNFYVNMAHVQLCTHTNRLTQPPFLRLL